MDTSTIVILIIVLLPFIYFFGGMLAKILWGLWPAVFIILAGGYVVYDKGMEYIIALPIALLLAICAVWYWQRIPFFLKVDALIGKYVFFD